MQIQSVVKPRSAWLLFFVALLAAPSASHAGPILKIRPAEGLPSCKVFIMPNGHQWRAQRHEIAAGGRCPSSFVSGRLISRNRVRLANGAVCTFGDTGDGTCR